MSKKYQVWVPYHNEDGFGMLIEDSKVESKICTLGWSVYKVTGVKCTSDNIDKLNNALEQYMNDEDVRRITYDMIEEVLEIAFPEASLSSFDDYENIRHTIAWDGNDNKFFDFDDCNELDVYHWWDGSNWKTLCADDMEDIIEVEVDEDEYDIDEWDGSNHAGFQEIVDPKDDKKYLLWTYSQYQGTHQQGKLVTREELLKFIAENHDEETAEEWTKEGKALENKQSDEG